MNRLNAKADKMVPGKKPHRNGANGNGKPPRKKGTTAAAEPPDGKDGGEQNRIPIRFSPTEGSGGESTQAGPPPVEQGDLANRSDQELTGLLNGHHGQFLSCYRRSVEHGREASKILIVLKDRRKHGEWGAWLKEHFRGSQQMAEVYMKIARNWPLIVELGLDREDVTLTKLRWLLSNSDRLPDETKTKKDKEDADDETATDAPPPKCFVVQPPVEEVEGFVSLAGRVGKRSGTLDPEKPDDYYGTINAALRHCDKCKGVRHA